MPKAKDPNLHHCVRCGKTNARLRYDSGTIDRPLYIHGACLKKAQEETRARPIPDKPRRMGCAAPGCPRIVVEPNLFCPDDHRKLPDAMKKRLFKSISGTVEEAEAKAEAIHHLFDSQVGLFAGRERLAAGDALQGGIRDRGSGRIKGEWKSKPWRGPSHFVLADGVTTACARSPGVYGMTMGESLSGVWVDRREDEHLCKKCVSITKSEEPCRCGVCSVEEAPPRHGEIVLTMKRRVQIRSTVYTAARRERCRAAGKCPMCGKAPPRVGGTLCEECVVRRREQERARSARFKAAGLCARCGGGPVTEGSASCGDCLLTERVKRAARKQRDRVAEVAS